jgi:hypothetical protein
VLIQPAIGTRGTTVVRPSAHVRMAQRLCGHAPNFGFAPLRLPPRQLNSQPEIMYCLFRSLTVLFCPVSAHDMTFWRRVMGPAGHELYVLKGNFFMHAGDFPRATSKHGCSPSWPADTECCLYLQTSQPLVLRYLDGHRVMRDALRHRTPINRTDSMELTPRVFCGSFTILLMFVIFERICVGILTFVYKSP